MELAPICVFSYNRPEHLKRTLEALSKNDLAGDSVLYIFCDGAKDFSLSIDVGSHAIGSTANKLFYGSQEEYNSYIKTISENINVAKSQCWAKESYVIVRDINYGLAANIVAGVTEVVNKYGKIIVLEDDMLTSYGFLKYMNDALTIYNNTNQVMAICSYMFSVKHKWMLPETFFYSVPYPGGGWATWSRAWKFYNDDIKYHYELWNNKWEIFNKWGNDLQKQLTMNYHGEIHTWFIKWYSSLLQQKGLTLYPKHSLVTNIGFDGTGANCPKLSYNKFWVDNLVRYVNVRKWTKIKENTIASYLIYIFWSGHWYSKGHRTEWKNKIFKNFHNGHLK